MNKEIFLHQLRIRLCQLPPEEQKIRLDYYEELIDDMTEDGMSEEDAVAGFGNVDDIARKIMMETPMSTLVKSKVMPKNGWSTAAIVLAIIGSPVWVPLLFAAITVALSVVLVIFSLIVSAYLIVVSLGIAGVYLIFKAFWLLGTGFFFVIFTIGSGFVLVGLCLLAFQGAKYITIGLIKLGKWLFEELKSLFIKKEAA